MAINNLRDIGSTFEYSICHDAIKISIKLPTLDSKLFLKINIFYEFYNGLSFSFFTIHLRKNEC